MFAPKTLSDIQQMIKDQVQENVHLDYKDSQQSIRVLGTISQRMSRRSPTLTAA